MIEYYTGAFDLLIIDNLVHNIPWREMEWSRGKKLPRLVSKLTVEELVHYVPETISIIDNVTCNIGSVKSCWLNYYRDGNDYTPYHQDTYGCKVLNISFGGVRRFAYRPILGGQSVTYDMHNGDCILFDQEFNALHLHTVTKTKKQCQPRVSLVLFIEWICGLSHVIHRCE